MLSHYDAVIKSLSGDVNGVNKEFYTPTEYVAGTLRLVVNGKVYRPGDDTKRWTEIDSMTIELDEAPIAGDVLQAFYQDMETEHVGLANVKGGPFDPNGMLP